MAQTIPTLDLSDEIKELENELNQAIQSVMGSTQFICGPNLRAFEKEVAQYLGTKHAVGLNSGTDALVIGLRALGVGWGDEVISSPFTFFATIEAICQVGATPVFVDIDPKTFNLNPDLVVQRVTPKTKAIIPVHLFGNACDMNPLLDLSHKHKIAVLEDVAQAFGGCYHTKKLGTLGDVGAFSFFPSKNLGAFGDGGLLVTDNDNVFELAQRLRNHGAKHRFDNECLGYNSRLDEIQAAVLRVKLKHVDRWNQRRADVANQYDELIGNVPGVCTPVRVSDCQHVFHQYTIRLTQNNRDDVKRKLQQSGVSSAVYYSSPIHTLPMFSHINAVLPECEKAAKEVLSLPIWPHISQETVICVANTLRQAVGC